MTVSNDHIIPAALVQKKLIELAAKGLVGLGVLLSGFVIFEPAPYELLMVVAIPLWALLGLRISSSIVPLIVLLVLFNIGGFISMMTMEQLRTAPIYLAVSLFLAMTSVFFAAILEYRPQLIATIFFAWVVAAFFTSLFGILGYFHAFPGAEIFTRYERAAGVFEDPNVFGPYLIVPALFITHNLLTGAAVRMPFLAAILLTIVLGIFLSFSRGAWGMFALCETMLLILIFAQNRSGNFRVRLIIMGILAILLLLIAIIIALQIPSVATTFQSRAQLVQEYDGGQLGRFARHITGFIMATENPLGIGPLEFGNVFGEDTHNIWLKALLAYGWIGFIAFVTLTFWTLAASFRILFRPRPWQPYLLCIWIAFFGHIVLATVIDIDHWRHFYIILGILWGFIALETRVQNAYRNGRAHNSLDWQTSS